MNLSAPFILRPVMTTFVMLTLVIAGCLAFFKLPVNDLPTIEHPKIQVFANYSGASSEVVLNQVTIPIEKELSHVKGVQEMDSTSSLGFSKITLSFDLSHDMNEAIRDVQSALNRANSNLPRGLTSPPSYALQEDSQEAMMWIVLTSDYLNVGELRQYVDAYILPRLSRLAGVAQVQVYGAGKSIQLQLNPELMAARQIGFNQVIETVRQYTTQMPLGTIQTSSKSFSIEWPGSIQQVKDLENLKVINSSVYIKDIGAVVEKSGQEKEFRFVTPEKSSRALVLGVQKVSGGNTVALSRSVREVVKLIEKELPPSTDLLVWFDKSVWIKESLLDLEWSLLLAFALVVLVIYFSLGRLTDSLITGIALPLSILGTFILMYLAHFSLDLLSLLALTLSVGFVVDDAIVVLENVVRYQEKGESPKTASLMGSKQICFTILCMTLSLVAVFIPLIFLPGMNGRLFREFSVTLAVAILVSGFVSLTLTPMLCSRFLSNHSKQTRLQIGITEINNWMVSLYGKTLKACFRFPKTILSIAILSIVATGFLFFKLPVNLIPSEDRGFFFALANLPTGIESAQVSEKQRKLEGIIQSNAHVDKFLSLNLDSNLLFIVQLKPLSQRPALDTVLVQVRDKMETVPGVQIFTQPYQLINLDIDFGNAGQYKLIIRGLDFTEVEKAASQLVKKLQSRPEFSFVQSSIKNDAPILKMQINETLMHQLGFERRELQELLQNAFGQGFIGSIQRGSTQENIYIDLLPEFKKSLNAPEKLFLTTRNGSLVPFKALASWHEELGSPNFMQYEQLPAAVIRFALAKSVEINKGLQVAEDLARESLPEHVKGELIGSAKVISSTLSDTLILLLAAALVMYLVLGVLYESFIHPLTILSSIPFAGLGGVLTLFLFGEPISIFSVVGFLLLIGIVKKNGIMMVDYALDAKKQNVSSEQAIYEACLVRFRPIMMTTVAAIMGAIPIAIGLGAGADMHRGLGLVIVGGLLFSQLLTLYVTPIIYLTFETLFVKKRHGLIGFVA